VENYLELNRSNWDARVPFHEQGYGLERFRDDPAALPIGEAASYGKLCITSPHSSMPEVAGQYADYVSPYDPAALLAHIERYLDAEVLAAREAEVRSGFKVRSWDESFEDFVSALGLPLS
jgi:hypothetical protein